MIDAEEFVALLEKKDLVSPEVVAHLRRQIARPNSPISAALIAKWLVDRGHLSRLLAQRLLTQAEDSVETAEPRDAAFDWERQAEGDELGLAPLDDEIAGVRAAEPKKPPPAPKPKPTRASGAVPPAGRPPQKPGQPAPGAAGGSLLDEEFVPLGGGATGLGALDGVTDESALTASDGGPLAPVGRKKGLFGGRRRRGRRDNVWDSPLLLIGGGALLLLLFVGGALYWRLTAQSAEGTLEVAEKFYREGSYTKAIAQYNDYLKKFPNHEGVSLARVRSGLAQLRQATDYASDWPKALSVANEVLGEIAQEEEFRTEARPELVAMLPKIAQGLADKARADLDSSLVTKCEEALALVNKYLPASSRPVTKLADIQALLALTTREIARGKELEKAIAGMKEAVEQDKTAEAYSIRTALLKEYASLVDNEQLRETVLAVSQAELSGVKVVDEPKPAEAAEASAGTVPTVALARRTTTSAPPGAEGHVIFLLARGAAYGLDATSGEILWRRPVGFAINGRSPGFPPTAISEKPGSDAIMVDSERHEVLRVEAATGQPRWRHALGEPFDAHPVVADNRLLVATRSGRLVWIDLETGGSPGYVQLPQELRVGPSVDSRRSTMYQIAEHSNLFVLSLAKGEPKQVVYLGHAPGSVTVPTVVVNRYLVVAENDGVKHSTLRVLALEADEEGQPPVHIVQSVRLKGHVDSPPQVYGVRMLVATDQGELNVFEISATDVENPLARVAEGKTSSEAELTREETSEGLIRFPLLRGGQVWIADNQLTQYDLQPSQGRLQPRGVRNERSATLQPLVSIGQTVFHVRRKLGFPGVLVSAVGPDENEPYWETHLAAPLAAEPIVDAQAGQITAVTSIGAVFQLPTDGLEGPVAHDQPTVALKPAELNGPVTDVFQVQNRLLVMAAGTGAKQLPVYDPQEGNRFRWLFLPGALGGRPIPFADGLIVPCEVGQVFLLDPRSGSQRTEPFQPALKSGVRVAWSQPALVGQNEILLSESHTGLYRIGIQDRPKPHLAMLAQVDLPEGLVSPIAVVGNVAYAVDAAESLVAFELPDLTAGEPRPLGARSAWGPGRVGDHVLLATDDDQLYCLDAGQKIVWQVPLLYGPLAGRPLSTESGDVLAATSGVIWRLDPATGRELAKIVTGAPLGTGPVPFGDGLLVGGYDGCLYKVQMP
ncbi:MAG TPA: PQQ-binding-like beta-propeller repeat protein [Thermoguttaceae bacterium]|nr:PQQ-binding-like beta-propeller repeat protein [Thermoguttaceae bacterium]